MDGGMDGGSTSTRFSFGPGPPPRPSGPGPGGEGPLPAKERLGAFIYHPVVSVAIVLLILLSVALVILHLTLHHAHPWQPALLAIEYAITTLFAVEIAIKAYVAPDRLRFLSQYWIDIIAIIPWVQSLRVLRILRLLRVFRAAMLLSRRFRFMSALFRSAMGEYLVLAMILITLLTLGSFTLYLTERHERDRILAEHPAGAPHPPPPPEDQDLTNPMNAVWATVFFMVANEPMVGVPRTTVGKAVTLAVMFGGLTTFAIFTGVVSALMVTRLRRRMEIDDMDRFQLTDHLVILGWNSSVPLIVDELQVLRTEAPALVIVAELEELPQEVARLKVASHVFFVPGDYTKPDVLELARIQYARRAIIVADSTKPRSDQDRDARTVLAALMVERMNPKIISCAELLNRQNEAHLRAVGIEEVITTSEAGGHHLAMAAMHPGLANVLSELLTAKKGKTLVKQAVPDDLVGATFLRALEQLKHDRNSLLLGVEVLGRDGSRTPGYSMNVNPPPETILGPRDNLVLIIDGTRT
jgi:voltage-gated potassium channel